MKVPAWYEGDVSRETIDKLKAYAALIRKWTVKINLISKSTEQDLEIRHIWDSAQTYRWAEGIWLDLGSGGGLPGIVIAILAQGEGAKLNVSLVESDQRKAVFLRTCARELDVPCRVYSSRIEDIGPVQANVLSARALADLDGLLAMAELHLGAGGTCMFMKGARWRDEVLAAQRNWRFSYDALPSKTHPEAVILEIKEIERV
ncbi:MAG: 16S rRNA (guanine(527)-N(7))-methyltransferase RsmG [Tateyamaria sp.]|uniref:16S rRNA (guanine(527)-N(7))-methyltransferase RsmG n=1 Tax=Tateyamaria sp. TaxID=1929288 RepID=UPI00329B847C